MSGSRVAVACCCVAAIAGCQAPAAPLLLVHAAAWPEADALFRNDARWIGGDGAYSVALGGGRVLWLFGDSFIALDAARSRQNAVLVRNSLAVQRGTDPSAATLAFFTRSDGSGRPASFVPEDGAHWFWPGAGVRLGGRLLLFFSRVGPASGGLGFQGEGWTAFLVDNPDEDPSAWTPRALDAPANPWHLTPGAGGVQVDGAFLVAYAVQEPSHDLFLVRWSLEAASGGDLSAPSWWAGAQRGWVAQPALSSQPEEVMPGVGTEFSVHFDATTDRFVEIDTDGFGATELVARVAGALTGPWSGPTRLYRPPESDRADTIVYAGKAHPELTGAFLVATYASNSLDFSTLVNDMSLYYPRFVRLTAE
jgi:hypothetical protein